MGRRGIIITIFAVVFLAAAAFVYFTYFRTGTDPVKDMAAQGSTTDTPADAVQQPSPAQPSPAELEPIILKTEDIVVDNNSPEFDLKVSLYENSDKRTFIRMEYYFEGASAIKEIDSSSIPEIEGIFGKRDGSSTGNEDFSVKAAYLNSRFSKVYLIIQNGAIMNYNKTSLYSVSLKDLSVKRIFENTGKYGALKFNKGLGYLAYSFYDPPYNSMYQEDALFEVINCETDDFIIKGSRDLTGKKAGTNRDTKIIYDYTFITWNADTAVRLKQTMRPSGQEVSGNDTVQSEVVYDITKNLFLNPDGSIIQEKPATAGNTDSEKPAVISEAMKTLKSFYGYLASQSDYAKGMALLDDKFTLQLDLLKQFGIEEIYKSDIDEESASTYSDMLKAAKLETIVKEEQKGGVSTIYYYQVLSINSDSQSRQAMSAQLKKSGTGWKILAIKDADAGKPPFS